jgi:16S rRNA (guanine966-N2)-methyltransferase
VRIVAGTWRGRTLVVPPGDVTRPTADRTREALFSILTSRLGAFEGLAVADIFAGTGALGLEALSRGAAHCTFVEQDRGAVRALRANVEALSAQADIVPLAVAALGPARRAHDLLMFDPPYGSGGAGALIERLTRLGWAAEGAWASVETRGDEQVSARGWIVEVEKRYGLAKLTVLRRAPAAQPG